MATHYVRSDLYKAGTDELGHDYIAEFFFVVLELDDGRRFASTTSYDGAKAWSDGEGGCGFADVREEAEAKATALLDTLSDTPNDTDWRQIAGPYC